MARSLPGEPRASSTPCWSIENGPRRERGIANPEIVAPETIHPAFQKAAHYFDLRLVRVPVRDFLADVDAMRAAITPNTIALAGSAGNYPYGLIDPLEQLSALAVEKELGLHVDGCLGGFILPWIERLGYTVPPFDFRLPGVTSMSCDTHKYGYALKGTSVVLYRNRHLRRFQYFKTSEWQGGVYVSPTLQGSRSEGLTAATWAALVTMGETGYLEARAPSCRRPMRSAPASPPSPNSRSPEPRRS